MAGFNHPADPSQGEVLIPPNVQYVIGVDNVVTVVKPIGTRPSVIYDNSTNTLTFEIADTRIDADADILPYINELSTVTINIDDIVAVGTDIANVNTVATNIADVNLAAANMDAIIAAPAEAASAAVSAAYVESVAFDVVTGIRNTENYVADGIVDTFAISYNVGYVDVFLDGIFQVPDVDFTATDGSNVVFISTPPNGVDVQLIGWGVFLGINEVTEW